MLNELVFLFFVEKGTLTEGFAWLEGIYPRQGLDFLRFVVEELVEPRIVGSPRLPFTTREPEKYEYEVAQGFHPYDVKYGEIISTHDVVDDSTKLCREAASHYLAIEFYSKILLRHLEFTDSQRESISAHINEKYIDYLSWVGANQMFVVDHFFPPVLGEAAEQQGDYDGAIEVYSNSHLSQEESNARIEQCKYKRDGYIYDELRKALKNLGEIEQKQMLAYIRLFHIELRLRNLVDSKMRIVSNNHHWFEGENNSKIVDVRKRCSERKKEYDSNSYFREDNSKHELIDFTTLQELIAILEEKWNHFSDIFGPKQAFFSVVYPICSIRNEIAHARFLDTRQYLKFVESCDQIQKRLDQHQGQFAQKDRLRGAGEIGIP